ncbi:MAG: HypC/HybG/HupF family hydrogenase formation chaperone [Capsulimonadaceae bacterium]
MCLAIPGMIKTISGDDPLTRTGRVSFSGIMKDVCLAYVPEAKVGDYVLVHVGFALDIVDQDEARLVFSYLEQMGAIDEIQEATA